MMLANEDLESALITGDGWSCLCKVHHSGDGLGASEITLAAQELADRSRIVTWRAHFFRSRTHPVSERVTLVERALETPATICPASEKLFSQQSAMLSTPLIPLADLLIQSAVIVDVADKE